MGERSTRTAVVYEQGPAVADRLDGALARASVSVLARTSDGNEAATLVAKRRPDLLLVAARGADVEQSLACVRHARQASPSTRSVVFGAARDRQQIEAAFAAGAAVYCVATASSDDVATAIGQAFERSIFQPAPRTDRRARTPSTEAATAAPRLTRREREILRLVGEGCSNAQVAGILCVTEQTVKFHLSNVYRKLEVSNRTEASRWAQMHGLLGRRAGELARP
jgi:DNA-binding NarL/FixJ family response regulator